MTVLLDTNICIALINQTDSALAQRVLERSSRSVVLCSVVRAELEFGARNSVRVAENIDRVAAFCRPLRSLAFDDGAAAHYGSIRAQLRREGRPIGGNDLLIASIALAHDVPLATKNVDEFRRVPGLRVEAW